MHVVHLVFISPRSQLVVTFKPTLHVEQVAHIRSVVVDPPPNIFGPYAWYSVFAQVFFLVHLQSEPERYHPPYP